MTAYDYPTGRAIDRAHLDMCLVGDSLAMVALGYASTTQVTMDEMIHHARAVARGCKRAFLIGDLPFGAFEHPQDAARNAARYVREAQMEAVKLEGGRDMAPSVREIVRCGVPVMGHIGLTPQRQTQLGGFRVQGKSLAAAQRLVEDALALQDAGCFSLVLEAIPEDVAAYITQRLAIPTIGIGAGASTSGQVLVLPDALGVEDRVPKFCRQFGDLGHATTAALAEYHASVREGRFPQSGTHTYAMPAAEREAFLAWTASQPSKNS
ncbi:hypothetical protein CXG81DRAFT_10149 [Caulochytrium protostelioides]|uniref:3-methyl-2-oxobutanoate hydroxymethyltransferase n=1 Tax=Caulochytrium protostelioides TaxID=1555241 RepID=A0A4P9XBY6_9FUNG|nr:hypothetical protein CXG81DRAFT_10149 [Caulochytrium protostelioides]|eukprot:RKP02928.1 hypothetical protein CXG81DRAFT_10149 [Caulochytrium protostelioides]